MATLPGVIPQVFPFSVRDDAVADKIQRTAGQRVALSYEQHRGVPTSPSVHLEAALDDYAVWHVSLRWRVRNRAIRIRRRLQLFQLRNPPLHHLAELFDLL